MIYLQVALGFILLLGGAEFLVRGAVSIAERLGVSPLVIGMTIVALGTSAPEAVVSVNAALAGAAGLAVGNVVGSNIANVLLILGAAALVKPIVTAAGGLTKDGAVMMVGTVVFIALALFGVIDLWRGIILLVVFTGFLGYNWWRETAGRNAEELAEIHMEEVKEFETNFGPIWVSWLVFFVGLGALLWGADLLVDGGVTIARQWGVSEEVIGLTMVAIGTSLPELAASVVAAIRGHSEVALGNVLGSNLFNLLFVIGLASLFAPIPVAPQILSFDLWVMFLSSLVLMPFLGDGKRFGRAFGGLFLVVYFAYIGMQAVGVENVLGL